MNEKETKSGPVTDVVGLNTHVRIELVSRSGENENLEFDIVPDRQADFYSGLLSENTPLAQALLGHTSGTTVLYQAGDIIEVRILAVTAGKLGDRSEAAARRKEAVKEAIRQADRTNALIFATSVEGKWGDYDADGLDKNWK